MKKYYRNLLEEFAAWSFFVGIASALVGSIATLTGCEYLSFVSSTVFLFCFIGSCIVSLLDITIYYDKDE